MQRNRTVLSLILLLAAFGLLAGCSSDSNRALVQGTITLDGKPLPGASVVFQPQQSTPGQTARGRTDDSGKYTLRVRGQESVVPGEYRVEVKVVNEIVNNQGMVVGEKEDPKLKIDRRFNDQTTLTANVQPGQENDFSFDVSLK
ncbi:hypothetical protein Pan97_38460 [Bremerella volcania]|uniref:Carboxypeptidase regulatory-like domain-containing protein n=1 Tax=Bremerella volcania TaxID=2527984 RepID=A0A518CC44_9BACT|nr:carboxypeptidase-like regulatory domain-containing protein [Bremerella volcania]QDU76789.1 hypothetical protein Pan97_38460 [Bremerella volcania]